MAAGRPQDSAVADAISTVLARHGQILRGGFRIKDAETFPPGITGSPAMTVLLVGNAGEAMWPHFSKWRSRQFTARENPLDEWTRAVLTPVANKFSARAIFPFDKPYWPFQQWATQAEGLRASPLGILMHPEYGLWHAYRAALVFEAEISIHELQEPIHLCDECVEKPCLSACPVDAFLESGFAVGVCRGYFSGGTAGCKPDCMGDGCAARNACPFGAAYRYPPEQLKFHMAAFAAVAR